ncbi:MAG: hypothetical protein HOP29_00010 [Phycisphaerales bacterium]|nr:hypothetical protein [Phycisphaerales bacterium]
MSAVKLFAIFACGGIPTVAPTEIGVVMITGDTVRGPLLDARDGVFVLEVDGFPTAISYDQLEPESAYRARTAILEVQRGPADGWSAADRFELGRFCLRRNQEGLARRHFATAMGRDVAYRDRVDATMAEYRAGRSARAAENDAEDKDENVDARRANGGASRDTGEGTDTGGGMDGAVGAESKPRAAWPDAASSATAEAVIAGYKEVGERLRARVGTDIRLLETARFLIWTDWAKSEHADLERWCEQMYAVVAERFGLRADASVFAGKCPVFCLRSKKRFGEVAGALDRYDVSNALGYTISEPNGHVHVVVCRLGGSEAGRDVFASTLVHELSHAFLHRYRSARRVPLWLNEGLANVVAEDVLGDRCFNAEAAEAGARAFAGRDLALGEGFWKADSLDARYYPIAHSVVAYLIGRDGDAFRGLVDDVKKGVAPADALNARFGMSYDGLESAWRGAHR